MKKLMAIAALAITLAAANVIADEKITVESKVSVFLDNPAAKEILAKHLPDIATRPELEQARDMALKDLQQYDSSITNEKLAAIDADLAKVATKK
jgi:hypothetical protein